jgi:hypothetical protein
MAKGRGRLSSIDLLPKQADHIISWAAQALSARDLTQTEIYADFVGQCEELMAEHRGELEFEIPSFSSFNRYSMRQAKLTRRIDQTREIVASVSDKFDAKSSDDLAMITGETIKALVFQIVAGADEEAVEAKDVMQLASAYRQTIQGLNLSSDRRRKEEAEFASKVGGAVDAAAKSVGMTREVAEKVKAEILGVTS